MDKQTKILTFEYLVTELLKWEGNGNIKVDNDFSILKSLKLLFFVSAVGTDAKSENTLLDKVFDNFLAMTYGHVECEIYEEYKIKDGDFSSIKIDKYSTKIKFENFNYNIPNEIKSIVDNSIKLLKQSNENIVRYKTFDLVDLSHQYFSWTYFYNKARKRGEFKEEIPTEIIKNEYKYFYLS